MIKKLWYDGIIFFDESKMTWNLDEVDDNFTFDYIDQNQAERRAIKLGRENPLYYEVLEGLKPGEKVITSSYKDYKQVEVLNLE